MTPEKIEASTLATYLRHMVEQKGSDLYITSGRPVSARMKGKIGRLMDDDVLHPERCEHLVTECMTDKLKESFEDEQSANFSLSLEGFGRFRVNAFRQRCHAGLIARHIDAKVPTAEKLGLPSVFTESVMQKRGMVIMVGPTGSGKSTTLAAMVNHRNCNESGHIITIEDPIEFVHEHQMGMITQREVGTDTPTFGHALKDALRQDPDVILLGEIRDKSVMSHGLEFSNTGHLCLSTLHANNAVQAVDRIIRMFEESERDSAREGIAENLAAIFSQRLIKTKTGGVTAVLEILVNTPRISDLIKKGDTDGITKAMKEGANYQMHTFDQHLVKLAFDDIISDEVAMENADSKNEVRLELKKLRVDATDDNMSEISFAH